MWRASRRVPSKIKCLGQGRPTSGRAQQPCRHYAEEGADKSAKAAQARLQAVGSLPTETSSGGVAKTVLTATLAVGAGVGGLTVYAKTSPEFRKTLEGNIPYAREYLRAVLDRGPKMPDLGLGGVVDKAKGMVGMGKKKEEQPGSFLPKLSQSKSDEEEKQRKAAADTAAQAIAYGVDQPYPAEARVSSPTPPVKYIPTYERGKEKDEESSSIVPEAAPVQPLPVEEAEVAAPTDDKPREMLAEPIAFGVAAIMGRPQTTPKKRVPEAPPAQLPDEKPPAPEKMDQSAAEAVAFADSTDKDETLIEDTGTGTKVIKIQEEIEESQAVVVMESLAGDVEAPAQVTTKVMEVLTDVEETNEESTQEDQAEIKKPQEEIPEVTTEVLDVHTDVKKPKEEILEETWAEVIDAPAQVTTEVLEVVTDVQEVKEGIMEDVQSEEEVPEVTTEVLDVIADVEETMEESIHGLAEIKGTQEEIPEVTTEVKEVHKDAEETNKEVKGALEEGIKVKSDVEEDKIVETSISETSTAVEAEVVKVQMQAIDIGGAPPEVEKADEDVTETQAPTETHTEVGVTQEDITESLASTGAVEVAQEDVTEIQAPTKTHTAVEVVKEDVTEIQAPTETHTAVEVAQEDVTEIQAPTETHTAVEVAQEDVTEIQASTETLGEEPKTQAPVDHVKQTSTASEDTVMQEEPTTHAEAVHGQEQDISAPVKAVESGDQLKAQTMAEAAKLLAQAAANLAQVLAGAVSVGTDEPMPVAAKEPSAAHRETAVKAPAKEKKPVGVEKPEVTAAAAIAASMDEPMPPESKSEPKAKKKAEEKPATKKKPMKEKAEDTAAAAVAAGMDLPMPAKAMTTSGEGVPNKHTSKEENLVETPEDTAAAAVAAALDQPFATEARETPMRTPEEVQAKLLEKEIDDLAERAATVAIIQHELEDLKRTATSAIYAQEEAAHATKMHSEQIKHAMDEDSSGPLGKEEQWQAVTGAKEAKVDALKFAEASATAARENLEKARAVIKEGKSSLSEPDQEILVAEEELGKLAYELETAVGKVSKAQADAQVMQEYQDLVEQGRKQFKKELESIMPDVRLGGWRGKLSEDELNSLIAHAHRRIEQLQSQLAEQQLLEKSRMDDALARQRTEDEKEALALLKRELERQKQELALAQDLRIAQARDQYETEMRTQLRRQAAAHSEHLQDVLRVQEQELGSKHQTEMHDALMDERDRYQVKLNEAMARLRGVEAAIEGRADIEREARKAQELLIACETLKRLINTGNEEATSWEERRVPLSREVNTVKEAAGDSKFFQTLLDSVPPQAMEAGVFPEDSLRQRFLRVKRVCRRVAMIDETGGTLFQFFVSYLQSLLLVDAGRRSLPPGKEVDPKKLDTFTLLSYAEHSLENGDLEQAARFMNQLKGEPRKVASDWLEEARLTLEARQAAQALAAAAAAVGLGTLV
ncbi:IMMT [Branchiostoma lanceolatum]|uniref:MICOS complex subunit MIC60 n=1 Tax=Branchiostoma lanceolatum TaxID=7740 RepID=A0A8J9ZQA8_BRALA|nr:IMMT [Branchiostoma lanceolatum]